MKFKRMMVLAGSALLTALCVYLVPSQDRAAVPLTPFIALSSVSVPELPAKSAELVHAAAVSDRAETVRDVLRSVSVIARSGVMPYVVSALCKSDPEVAGSVVASAIELDSTHVVVFCKAALCAAPGQVEQIVFSASRTAPRSCADVALVASRELPRATDLILAGLTGALPALKPYLEVAQIQAGTNNFEAVIKQTAQLVADASQPPAK